MIRNNPTDIFRRGLYQLENRDSKFKWWTGALYWVFVILYLEIMLHSAVYGSFAANFGFAVAFDLSVALLLATVCAFLDGKGRFWVMLILTLALTVFYGSQMVYYFIFGGLYSVALTQQGGAAVTSFWRETLSAMGSHAGSILLMLIPCAGLFLLKKVCGGIRGKVRMLHRGILAAAALLVYLVTLQVLAQGEKGAFSNYGYYYSDTIATRQTVERFGLLTAFRLELVGSGQKAEDTEDAYYAITSPKETKPAEELQDQPDAEPEKVIEYNVMDLDLDALTQMTEDERIKALNAYCSQLTGTNKNEYTGLLKDYNLIVLCAESFSTAAIHPELTPTLYKLANEGIIFHNYYNSFPDTTTDGEYALCTGLFPDTSRGKQASSMYASRNVYMPFTLGNIWRDQLGIEAYGYHNYLGSYYGREESHPNMGYTMKFAEDGMTFTSAWPASDLEMMEQSVDDYIGQEQFHAYYMTFSGHYRYDYQTNAIAALNWEQVKDLPYTYEGKCYLSCNIELEKALAYLMQRLEEEGIADRTAIVIAGDHYPYGLLDFQYSDLIGYDIDAFSKFKSSLIFWVGGLEENIEVDAYCCNIDILPTILNLWGLEFDSRLMVGTDVFSDELHVAVLPYRGFATEKVEFSAETGEVRYKVDPETLPEGYVDDIIRWVSTKFSISSDILNTGYYNAVFGKEPAQLDRNIWQSIGR